MRVIFFVIIILVAVAAGCGGSDESGGDSAAVSDGKVTIGGVEYPVYPGARVDQNLVISVSFTVDAVSRDVEDWYDKEMEAAGWSEPVDWADFGGQRQKTFTRGETKGSSGFAEENVLVGVAPDDEGGTTFIISPIANKYGSQPD